MKITPLTCYIYKGHLTTLAIKLNHLISTFSLNKERFICALIFDLNLISLIHDVSVTIVIEGIKGKQTERVVLLLT